MLHQAFPGGLVVKNPPANAGDTRLTGFDPWVGKIPWRRKWQPSPVFLPGKSHGQRSLVGYCPLGHKESDTTKGLSTHTHTHTSCCISFPQPGTVLSPAVVVLDSIKKCRLFLLEADPQLGSIQHFPWPDLGHASLAGIPLNGSCSHLSSSQTSYYWHQHFHFSNFLFHWWTQDELKYSNNSANSVEHNTKA